MKILIISGFLGAGKTTFIQELIRRTGERFVVLENEYGETTVDEQIITQNEQTDVWGLSEGCVCCAKSADLVSSVVTIENVLAPEYLIVEPSGVGKLSNVIRNLQKIEYERITLLQPITIVDAETFAYAEANFADVYLDQLSTAGTVLISKPDHPDPALFAEVAAKIRRLNPDAELLDGHYTAQDSAWFRALLTRARSGAVLPDPSDADLGLEPFTVRDCAVTSPVELLFVLDNVLRGRYGEVVRAKGILPAGQEWLRFDIAGGKSCITGFEAEEEQPRQAETVWIGQGMDRFALMKSLHAEPVSRSRRIAL